jgi:hypothetical protein
MTRAPEPEPLVDAKHRAWLWALALAGVAFMCVWMPRAIVEGWSR